MTQMAKALSVNERFLIGLDGINVTMTGHRYRAMQIDGQWYAGIITAPPERSPFNPRLMEIQPADSYREAWSQVVRWLERDLKEPLHGYDSP